MYEGPYRGGLPSPYAVSHPIPTHVLRRFGHPQELYDFAFIIHNTLYESWILRHNYNHPRFLFAMEITLRNIYNLLQTWDVVYYQRMNVLISNRGWIDWGDAVNVTTFIDDEVEYRDVVEEVEVRHEVPEQVVYHDVVRRPKRVEYHDLVETTRGGSSIIAYGNTDSGKTRDRHIDRDDRNRSDRDRRDRDRRDERPSNRHDRSRDRSRQGRRKSSRDRSRNRRRSSSRHRKRSRSRDRKDRSPHRRDRSRSRDDKGRHDRNNKREDRDRDRDRSRDRDHKTSRGNERSRSRDRKSKPDHHSKDDRNRDRSPAPQKESSHYTSSTKYGKKRASTPPPEEEPATPFNPYAIFNVSRTTSTEELKITYRKLMRQYHPDKQMTKSTAEKEAAAKKAAEVTRAWAILGNVNKRAIYDEYGCTDGYTINEYLRKRGVQEEPVSWALVRPGVESEDEEVRMRHAGSASGNGSGKGLKGKLKGMFGKKGGGDGS
jgi:DnaJ-domain-containing protein 1